VSTADVDELVKDLGFLVLRCALVPLSQRLDEFVPGSFADLGAHAAPPDNGKILVRQWYILGKKNNESMHPEEAAVWHLDRQEEAVMTHDLLRAVGKRTAHLF
jgi:hypothetical protein